MSERFARDSQAQCIAVVPEDAAYTEADIAVARARHVGPVPDHFLRRQVEGERRREAERRAAGEQASPQSAVSELVCGR